MEAIDITPTLSALPDIKLLSRNTGQVLNEILGQQGR
jgi:hypothetical protein